WALITEGEDYVRRYLMPKKPSDADRPNLRWQSDGRDLPFYVIHNDEPCTAVLVSIVDEYSRYIVDWIVVPKKEKDESGTVYGVNFTQQHVGLLFASGMYRSQRRPEAFYTDHGTQFMAIGPYLPFLSDDNEPPIGFNNSRVAEPWGRGICEN